MKRTATRGGLLALACFALHASMHLRHGLWFELLWSCTVATLMIAVGLLIPPGVFHASRSIAAIGTLWLVVGTPLWLLDLLRSPLSHVTSFLTHVVGLVVGLWAARRADAMPEGTWWRAALAMVTLHQLTRWFTPWNANVNMVFGVYPPMRRYLPGFSSYYALSFFAISAVYFLVERALRKKTPPDPR